MLVALQSRPFVATGPQLRFGAMPPRLFSKMDAGALARYKDGERWRNPDHPAGKVVLTEAEINHVLNKTRNGAIYLLDKIGLKGLHKRLGRKALIHKMGMKRYAKEWVKSMLGDKNQDYIPVAYKGYWMHPHDIAHLKVAELDPIPMGKGHPVNGINGISSQVAPHFHPDKPDYRPQYNGLLDEYRVAIHQWQEKKSLISGVRLLFYMVAYRHLEKHPLKALKAHKKAVEKAKAEGKIRFSGGGTEGNVVKPHQVAGLKPTPLFS